MVTLIGSIVSGMEYNIGSNKCSSGKTIAVLIAFDGSGIAPDEINPFRISCVCLGTSSKYPSFLDWYSLLDYIKEVEQHG